MQFCSIIILASLFCETTTVSKSSIGLTGGALFQLFGDTSEAWPTLGSVMEISMPFVPSFGIRGTARLSWYTRKSGDLCLRNVAVIIATKYTKKIYKSPIGIYGGGGPGVHLYSWRKKEHIKGDNWIGFHFFTGIEYFFIKSKACCFGELDWGKEIGVGEKFPGFGELSQLGLTAGIRF